MSRKRRGTKLRNSRGNIKERFREPCHYCNSTKRHSIEHFVPWWVAKNAELLGIELDQKKNEGVACEPCNHEKGGSIDVSHEVSLAFWLDLRERINEEVDKLLGCGYPQSDD